MKDKKTINNPHGKQSINQKAEITGDFYDYFEDDEPYQGIQIT